MRVTWNADGIAEQRDGLVDAPLRSPVDIQPADSFGPASAEQATGNRHERRRKMERHKVRAVWAIKIFIGE